MQLATPAAEKCKPEDHAVDNFVIVLYNKTKYWGRIISLDEENGPTCMENRLKCW